MSHISCPYFYGFRNERLVTIELLFFLWDVLSRIRSLHLAVFMCNCSQAFFSVRFVSVYLVHPCVCMNTIAAGKKLFYFIGLVRLPYNL